MSSLKTSRDSIRIYRSRLRSYPRSDSQDTQHQHAVNLLMTRAQFAAALEYLYTTLNALSPTRLVMKASPYIKQNLQWELRMKPFSSLAHFACPSHPPITSTPPLNLAQSRDTLDRVQQVLEQAKSGFVTLLQLPVTSSIEHAMAVGALAREEQWKKDIKSEMRSVVSTGLVVAKVLRYVDEMAGGEKELGSSTRAKGIEEKKIQWHVEEVDDAGMRKGGGFGPWVVPVVEA